MLCPVSQRLRYCTYGIKLCIYRVDRKECPPRWITRYTRKNYFGIIVAQTVRIQLFWKDIQKLLCYRGVGVYCIVRRLELSFKFGGAEHWDSAFLPPECDFKQFSITKLSMAAGLAYKLDQYTCMNWKLTCCRAMIPSSTVVRLWSVQYSIHDLSLLGLKRKRRPFLSSPFVTRRPI